jgi:hypothetical protein
LDSLVQVLVTGWSKDTAIAKLLGKRDDVKIEKADSVDAIVRRENRMGVSLSAIVFERKYKRIRY